MWLLHLTDIVWNYWPQFSNHCIEIGNMTTSEIDIACKHSACRIPSHQLSWDLERNTLLSDLYLHKNVLKDHQTHVGEIHTYANDDSLRRPCRATIGWEWARCESTCLGFSCLGSVWHFKRWDSPWLTMILIWREGVITIGWGFLGFLDSIRILDFKYLEIIDISVLPVCTDISLKIEIVLITMLYST
jgi:hypothetical protein